MGPARLLTNRDLFPSPIRLTATSVRFASKWGVDGEREREMPRARGERWMPRRMHDTSGSWWPSMGGRRRRARETCRRPGMAGERGREREGERVKSTGRHARFILRLYVMSANAYAAFVICVCATCRVHGYIDAMFDAMLTFAGWDKVGAGALDGFGVGEKAMVGPGRTNGTRHRIPFHHPSHSFPSIPSNVHPDPDQGLLSTYTVVTWYSRRARFRLAGQSGQANIKYFRCLYGVLCRERRESKEKGPGASIHPSIHPSASFPLGSYSLPDMCQGVAAGASVGWVGGHGGPACDAAGADQSRKNNNKKKQSQDATLFAPRDVCVYVCLANVLLS